MILQVTELAHAANGFCLEIKCITPLQSCNLWLHLALKPSSLITAKLLIARHT